MILLSEMRLLQKQYILKALTVKAINGQDERRISCAAIDSPVRSCSAVIKAGSSGACLPPLILSRVQWMKLPQIEANFDKKMNTILFCNKKSAR